MTVNKRKIGLKTNAEKTVSNVLEEYQSYGTMIKLSPATIKQRQWCLGCFVDYVGDDTLCKNITTSIAEGYVFSLHEKYDNVSSIRVQVKAVKAFVNFCIDRGYMSSIKIPIPNPVETIKDTYSNDDLKRLLIKPTRNSFNQWKSWAISNFLLGTGCRVRTAINIKIKDLDFENQLISFTQTKNKKPQIVPMSSKLQSSLIEYLSLWDHTEDDYLFPNHVGQQMTADAFKRNVQRYNNGRGVMITSSHAYRHTFAKRWILNGGDVFRLQKILGHSTMDMVRKYVNMYGSDLQNDFDTFNPLDNMKSTSSKITLKNK